VLAEYIAAKLADPRCDRDRLVESLLDLPGAAARPR
jgi:hypothetical protein